MSLALFLLDAIEKRWLDHQKKMLYIKEEKLRLENTRLKCTDKVAKRIEEDLGIKIKGSATLKELLKKNNIHAETLEHYNLINKSYDLSIKEGIEIDIKYEGYLKRQENNIEQIKKNSSKALSKEIDYKKIETLSLEAREKLNKIKPDDVGAASQIPGVSKADLTALLVWLKISELKRSQVNI